MLLSPQEGPTNLHQVRILPPSASTSIHPPVPLVLKNPPLEPDGLPPSFAAATKDPQIMETLMELLDRLDLDSADSLRKYTKKILHEMVDVCIQGRSREDVQIRLDLLDDQWRNNKLSEMAIVKLGCLASALKNSNLKQADKLHLALMVDHITEVSQWMVGIKSIIHELKVQQTSMQPVMPKKLFVHSKTTMSVSTLTTKESPALNGVFDRMSSLNKAYQQEMSAAEASSSVQDNKVIQHVKRKEDRQDCDEDVDKRKTLSSNDINVR